MVGVSIVILNYDGIEALEYAVRSVTNQLWLMMDDYEILILENFSSEHSLKKVKGLVDKYHDYNIDYKVLDNKHRFITGLNNAFRLAKYQNVIFMENDILMKPHCLYRMLTAMTRKEKCIVQPIIKTQKEKIEKTHARWLFPGYGLNQKSKSPTTDVLNTSIFAMTKKTFRRIGEFDKSLAPAYMEDVDYSLRAKKLGVELLVAQDAEVIHFHNFTFSKFYSKNDISDICFRNRKYIIKKHYSGWERAARILGITVGDLFRWLAPLADGRIVIHESKKKGI